MILDLVLRFGPNVTESEFRLLAVIIMFGDTTDRMETELYFFPTSVGDTSYNTYDGIRILAVCHHIRS